MLTRPRRGRSDRVELIDAVVVPANTAIRGKFSGTEREQVWGFGSDVLLDGWTTRCPTAFTDSKPFCCSSRSSRKLAADLLPNRTFAAVSPTRGWVIERQICFAQTDAIDPPIKPSLQKASCFVEREPDARRTRIDRQDA